MTEKEKPPAPGPELRNWIRFKLGQRPDKKNAADLARETGTSEASVSRVLAGELTNGPRIGKIRRLAAELLGYSEEELFGSIAKDSRKKSA